MNSVLIFVYKENKNIFVFADICIKLWKNTKKKEIRVVSLKEGYVLGTWRTEHTQDCCALSNY